MTYFVLSVSLGSKTRVCFLLLLLTHMASPMYTMLDIYKKEKFHWTVIAPHDFVRINIMPLLTGFFFFILWFLAFKQSSNSHLDLKEWSLWMFSLQREMFLLSWIHWSSYKRQDKKKITTNQPSHGEKTCYFFLLPPSLKSQRKEKKKALSWQACRNIKVTWLSFQMCLLLLVLTLK